MSSMDYQPFPNTHWSLIRRAGGSGEERRDALAVVLARYQPALRSYLRAVRKMPAEKADDLLQAFIAEQLLEYNLIARADRSRGRFRTLLLTSLNNFAASRYRYEQRRVAEELPEGAAEAAGGTPEQLAQAAWARALVRDVIAHMERTCRESQREDIWLVFQGRVLAEAFNDEPPVAYEALAKQLQLESPAQAANLLVTGKRMYARLLRQAVGEYERDPDDIEAEIVELRDLLGGGAGNQGMAIPDASRMPPGPAE